MRIRELAKLINEARNYHISECVKMLTCAECEYKHENCKAMHIAEYLIQNGVTKEPSLRARWKCAGMGDYYCSLCTEEVSRKYPYCPHCGVKMEVSHE